MRIVEQALRSASGAQATASSSKDGGLEESLKAIPGPAFDVLQTVDEHGLPLEQAFGIHPPNIGMHHWPEQVTHLHSPHLFVFPCCCA